MLCLVLVRVMHTSAAVEWVSSVTVFTHTSEVSYFIYTLGMISTRVGFSSTFIGNCQTLVMYNKYRRTHADAEPTTDDCSICNMITANGI